MPYILNTEKTIKQMLKVIGVSSVEELYASLPQSVRLKEPLDIPLGLSEQETKRKFLGLSDSNKTTRQLNSFLGAGCYDHYIPSALGHILSQSEFLTAYTPYQAECSQGILQAIYEYQSYICLLTGMDVSNASVFDGASGLAEAVLMALRITKLNKVLVSSLIHPEYRKTLETYLSGLDFVIEEVKEDSDLSVDIDALSKKIDDQTACFVVQSPNFFGRVEDLSCLSSLIKRTKALTIAVVNPMSLAILKDPASNGADIVCGDGQPLGGALNFGGPSFGFLATKTKYLRQLPGRIVGKTVDSAGNPAYCLTMQAREQHIRREKATSNICSNQSLNAIGAAVYLSLMGKGGLTVSAKSGFNNAQYLYRRLKQVAGITVPFSNKLFNEFVWRVDNASDILFDLSKRDILGGYYLGKDFPKYENHILSCCTETKTKSDIDAFVGVLDEVLNGK
ncbi:MAG: aminomethyl-transferring glycine dehydrogenase subunit GcvPA [Candidatus Omnitrophica bacterium]|nr:aminomethyl-transferring glycine dehydrogenase subunit GcvPA [Candidatus Omnitrophota bacterium]